MIFTFNKVSVFALFLTLAILNTIYITILHLILHIVSVFFEVMLGGPVTP